MDPIGLKVMDCSHSKEVFQCSANGCSESYRRSGQLICHTYECHPTLYHLKYHSDQPITFASDILDENRRLKQLINVLMDLKQLCDSIVNHLDCELSSDIYNTYLELTEKYKQCDDYKDQEVEELPVQVKTEDFDEKDSLIVGNQSVTAVTAGQTTDNNQELNAQKSNEDSNNEDPEEQDLRVKTEVIDENELNTSIALTIDQTDNNNLVESQNINHIVDEEPELAMPYPEESSDHSRPSSESNVSSDVDDEDEDYFPSQSIKSQESKRSSKRFKCDLKGCEHLQFKDKYCLILHKRTHSSEKQFRCPFNGCLNRFERCDELIHHMSVYHRIKYWRYYDPILCGSCKKKFQCNMTFDVQDCHKQRPQQSHSLHSKINSCGICGQQFVSNTSDQRQVIHSDDNEEQREEELQCPVKTNVIGDENDTSIAFTASNSANDNQNEVFDQKSNERSVGNDIEFEYHSRLFEQSNSSSRVNSPRVDDEEPVLEESSDIIEYVELSSDSEVSTDLLDVDDEEYFPSESIEEQGSELSEQGQCAKRLRSDHSSEHTRAYKSSGHTRVEGLNQHKTSHSKKAFQCPANGCSESFRRSGQLIRHTYDHHPTLYHLKFNSDQPIVCGICNMKFRYEVTSENHKCLGKSSKYMRSKYQLKSTPLRKRSSNPANAFARQMRPTVLDKLEQQMAKKGLKPTSLEVNQELSKQWHGLTTKQKKFFIDKCKE